MFPWKLPGEKYSTKFVPLNMNEKLQQEDMFFFFFAERAEHEWCDVELFWEAPFLTWSVPLDDECDDDHEDGAEREWCDVELFMGGST